MEQKYVNLKKDATQQQIKLETSIKGLQDRINLLTKKINEKQEELRCNFNVSVTQAVESNRKINEMDEKIRILEDNIRSLEEDKRILTTNKKNSEETLKENTKTITQLRTKQNELEQKMHNQEQQLGRLSAEKTKVENENSDLSTQLLILTNKPKEATKQNTSYLKRITVLQAEVETLQNNIKNSNVNVPKAIQKSNLWLYVSIGLLISNIIAVLIALKPHIIIHMHN